MVPNPYRHVGELIRERRERLKLSQEELAERVAAITGESIGQNWVTRLETYQKPGSMPKPLERVEALCQVLGLTQAEMLAAAGYQVDPGEIDEREITDVMHEVQFLESLERLPNLTESQKEAFKRMYAAFREATVRQGQ